MSVLSRAMNNLPLAPIPAVVYWDERVGEWWPGVDRVCPVKHCGGRLNAVAPDGYASGPGDISCLNCGRFTSEIQKTRPAEQRRDEPDAEPRRGRPRSHESRVARLVRRLAESGADDLAGLSEALDLPQEKVRQAIRDAKTRGYVIAYRDKLYALERTP